MEHAQELLVWWSWLPGFRAVAETQHLSEAARQLGQTPAALSRTIAKLERALGVRLFERLSRGMRLTDEGLRLANQVRDAMRRLDDTRRELVPDALEVAPTHLAFAGHALGALLHLALPKLMRGGTKLRLEHLTVERMASALMAGDIDLAFSTRPAADDRIICRPIGDIQTRWVTLNSTQLLPPTGRSSRLEIEPAVAPLSEIVLRHVALQLPCAVDIPEGCRTVAGGPLPIWRLTRTRPSKILLGMGKVLFDAGAAPSSR